MYFGNFLLMFCSLIKLGNRAELSLQFSKQNSKNAIQFNFLDVSNHDLFWCLSLEIGSAHIKQFNYYDFQPNTKYRLKYKTQIADNYLNSRLFLVVIRISITILIISIKLYKMQQTKWKCYASPFR